ncbi:regulator of G-protein signaling 20 [Pimephales promelas]|uniref:regulator of G-protein signaling 20 n=1 Tax=Pimephales promelas TaxID=90988 RepID=UPI00195557C8|nr:regulator of G-protein signaling 20 [Pimephales promelas]
MGSERVEMGESTPTRTLEPDPTHTPTRTLEPDPTHTPTRTLEPDPTHTPTRTRDPPHTPANACCFCWCCCCSCSCLTVRSAKEEKTMTTISEEQEEADIEQMPQLTLEEVQSWAESFERLMKNPQGRLHFQQFLKSEFSEENLKFWLICEDLKKQTNQTTVEQTVKQIYEDYVSVKSPKEVSLDSRVRQVIHNKMQDPSSCTFDEAQLQIYTLMQRDSFPRFMNSSMYADLLQGLQTPSES